MMPDLNYILGEGHQLNMKHDAIYLRCIFGLFEDPEDCSTLNFKSEVTEEIVGLLVFEMPFLFQSAIRRFQQTTGKAVHLCVITSFGNVIHKHEVGKNGNCNR
jgi:hypothetical protein